MSMVMIYIKNNWLTEMLFLCCWLFLKKFIVRANIFLIIWNVEHNFKQDVSNSVHLWRRQCTKATFWGIYLENDGNFWNQESFTLCPKYIGNSNCDLPSHLTLYSSRLIIKSWCLSPESFLVTTRGEIIGNQNFKKAKRVTVTFPALRKVIIWKL